MTDPVSRDEYRDLVRRVDAIDAAGTRGVGVLAVQVAEVIKDMSDVRTELKDHRRDHEAESRARVVARRWTIGTVIALAAVIETPLLYLVAHLH